MKNVLRWLLVLPAAVGAYVATWLAISLLFLLSCLCISLVASSIINDMSWKTFVSSLVAGDTPWLLSVINGAAGGYFFVIAGAKTAPKRKFIVAVLLAVIICSLLIYGDLLGSRKYPVPILTVDVILGIGVTVVACVQEYRLEQQNSRLSAIYDAGQLSTLIQLTDYVASATGRIYHYSDCELTRRILSENKILFKSAAEACAKGYVACKVCKPR